MSGNRGAALMGALGGAMTRGFDDLAASDEASFIVALDDVEIAAQVREEFEGPDGEDSLAELGASLQKQQLQPILLRPNRTGTHKPYLLVAGERRVRAARLVGLRELRAVSVDMTDEQAAEAQFAENVHRKGLTLMEEAKRLKAELAALGSVEALCAKHGKGKSWVSKRLGLLDLPEQAARLIKERVSADPEVIHQVRAIERVDAQAAREAVDELQASRGKANPRKVAQAARDRVEGAKKPAKTAAAGVVATPKDRSQEQPSAATTTSAAQAQAQRQRGLQLAANAYEAVFERGVSPAKAIGGLSAADCATLTAWLAIYFDLGKRTQDTARCVIEGMRGGALAADGACALGMVALLHGATGRPRLDLLDVLASVTA